MIRAGIVGLGKMGLSHQAMVNAHPDIELKAVCDSSTYVLDVLSKYTGVTTYADAEIVAAALERGLHVFCEKPFGLDPAAGYRLADMAEGKGLVNQVGYHYRFVAAFNEAKRLLDQKLIGDLHHVRIEAYGPVVLRPKGSTWRAQKSEGGGALFDYACHAIDLTNYLIGAPISVSGTVLNSVFSTDVDDEIYSTLQYSDKFFGQLATNWSDDSYRKMSVRLNFWGSNGRINVDRQEIQIYLRSNDGEANGFTKGWNVRYTTELTRPVWFYVRGEEYSAQIDHFVQCIKTGATPITSFRSASDTVLVAAMLREDAGRPRTPVKLTSAGSGAPATVVTPARSKSFVRSLLDRF
jgi:scyllo-inositol 2-dehydrogenase (NADP+)